MERRLPDAEIVYIGRAYKEVLDALKEDLALSQVSRVIFLKLP